MPNGVAGSAPARIIWDAAEASQMAETGAARKQKRRRAEPAPQILLVCVSIGRGSGCFDHVPLIRRNAIGEGDDRLSQPLGGSRGDQRAVDGGCGIGKIGARRR